VCGSSVDTTHVKSGIFDGMTLLFLHPETKKNFLVTTYLWCVNQITFYMTILNLDEIDNKFPHAIYTFYIADILSNLSTAFFSHTYGRKITMNFGSIMTALVCIVIYFIYDTQSGHFGSFVFFLYSYFACLCGNTVYLYGQELFEANIVATASAYSKMPSKFLLILMPLMIDCNKYMFLLMGMIVIVVPFLLVLTKETRHFS